MRSRKKTTLILVLGLLLTASTAGMAQTPLQTDQKATESCCCCADSCDMKMKDDTTMKHDMKVHKGDCCKMKQKDKNKKAA